MSLVVLCLLGYCGYIYFQRRHDNARPNPEVAGKAETTMPMMINPVHRLSGESTATQSSRTTLDDHKYVASASRPYHPGRPGGDYLEPVRHNEAYVAPDDGRPKKKPQERDYAVAEPSAPDYKAFLNPSEPEYKVFLGQGQAHPPQGLPTKDDGAARGGDGTERAYVDLALAPPVPPVVDDYIDLTEVAPRVPAPITAENAYLDLGTAQGQAGAVITTENAYLELESVRSAPPLHSLATPTNTSA
eukprot:m.473169 g.473169  ORF g.473169 m.473169 type:complete len:245 (+) comp33831_c0_seq1:1289-2023(+)